MENLKQHVAHFVEICNNVRIKEDLLVKKNVHSLKGYAFDSTQILSQLCK